jgi:nucleoside-triphosphatase THEP1
VLGSLWASNEIIIGSFLHNLKVPFAGTLLASIGVCILTAGLRIWKDPRVLWRAGVICALMKSVSPSSVILGPMVGIMLEAFLFWFSVLAFRSHLAGIVLGAVLATVSSIIQKLLGLIVTYGLDVARLYVALFDTVTRSINIQSIGPDTAIILFITLTALPGLVAAGIGIRVARAVGRETIPGFAIPAAAHSSTWTSAPAGDRFNLLLLALHMTLLMSGLVGLSYLPPGTSLPFVLAYALFTLIRYPRVRRRFSHVRLWIEVMIVALLAGVFLGQISSAQGGWSWAGLQTGFQMAMRALFVVLGFSAISIELRNPVVGGWFLRRGLGQVSRALEIAFEALPTMTAALGEQRRVFRHPFTSLTRMVGAAVSLIPHFQKVYAGAPDVVVLLTGSQGSGKTTLLGKVVRTLHTDGVRVGGILSPVVYDHYERTGYDVVNIPTGQRCSLCRKDPKPDAVLVGPFFFDTEVLLQINDALRSSDVDSFNVIIIDEVGPLELSGGGWAPALDHLLTEKTIPVILTVRPQLADAVCARWRLSPTMRWDTGSTDATSAADDLRRLLREEKRHSSFRIPDSHV